MFFGVCLNSKIFFVTVHGGYETPPSSTSHTGRNDYSSFASVVGAVVVRQRLKEPSFAVPIREKAVNDGHKNA